MSDDKITTPPPIDNLKVFAALCDARAQLWAAGHFDLHDAVDRLEQYRVKFKIDADTAQAIMAKSFAAVRDDLDGWVPGTRP